MKYYFYTITNPKSERYMQPISLYRMGLKGEVLVTEKWDSKGGWKDAPELIGVIGMGGDDSYMPTDEEKALEFIKGKGIRIDIEKAKIYLIPGEKPPKGVQVQRGPRGGLFYDAKLPGRQWEKGAIKNVEWQRATGNKTPGGMVIPATWIPELTFVNRDKNGSLQAAGIDQKDRKVYLRLSKGKEKGRKDKFKRLKKFTSDLPKIMKRLEKDAGKKEEAMILQIMAMTGCRVGSTEETTGDKPAFGIATLLRKHVKVKGSKVILDFPGKDGIRNLRTIKHDGLAKKIANIKDPNQKIFNVDYKHTLEYLHKISGKPYKTHDFRTWVGTKHAIDFIKEYPMPTNAKEFRKLQIAVGKRVGELLSNTYSIALNHYISPDVWTPIEAKMGLALQKSQDYFDDIEEMLETVQYGEEEDEREAVVQKTRDFLEKAKIYLAAGERPPEGKQIETGSRGGKFYESGLRVLRHAKRRGKQRHIDAKKIEEALSYLEERPLPTTRWWHQVDGGGIIAGEGEMIMTILRPGMKASGIRIK